RKMFEKNAEFLMNTLPGTEISGKAKVKCRHRDLVKFAKVYGLTNPKYVADKEQEVTACKAWANAITVKSFYILIPATKLEKDGEERPFLLNPNKLLHAGNHYNWEGCVPIKSGDKIISKGKWGKMWLVEDNMILFAELLLTAKNQNDETVVKVTTQAAVRPGGY
ncbi:MAG: MaoC family dehydratase N-terminal domain-containing protein, partial [Candidatus Lokiarchaeota archaeon]